MIQASTLQFLKALKKNNTKEWFDKNRDKYSAAKSDFEALVHDVLKHTGKFDKNILHLQPKDCTFRINRDVRFSKDKSPYKTNMGMYITAGGKKSMITAGYYFHLEPGGCFVAGGMWMPMAPELKKIRQEIDYNWSDFHKLLNGKKFKAVFGDLDRSEDVVLSRPPKGYEADNPAIEYLKLKSFIVKTSFSDAQIQDAKAAAAIAQLFETLQPLVQFLNQAVMHTEE